ncbi:putative transporter small subunit [Isoalcanivorax beigongshangi]|uniref:Transporter small subunit n=1 Tax=Isoalcanivorax beigongshangi TaxID=3238810 RepID=A0ABV4AL28_9GAMM
MTEFIYGAYILAWPALTLGVLIYICRAVWRDVAEARREQRDLV